LERSHYALKLGTRLLYVAIDFAPLMLAVAAPHAVVAVGVAMTLCFEKSGVKAEKVTETLEAIGKSDDFARAIKATPANKPMFYVKSTGEALPSTGYRHFDSGDGFVRSIIDNGGNIPAS